MLVSTGKAQDVLVLHNGNRAEGKVLEKKDNGVKFVYQGEDAVNLIGSNAIHEIHYQSGRTELVTEKVDIASPTDWQKVRVVYDKDEVIGLKSLGQVEKHSSGTWSFAITAGHFSEKTLKKLRQEAAKRGGCIVLILSSQSSSGDAFKDGHAFMSGEIYTY